MITHEIHLTAGSLVVNHDIYAVQYDTDRSIRMFIDDIAVTSGMTGRLEFQRSDGTHYGLDATLETATNSFYISDITQLLTQAGKAKCQLKISNNGSDISTYTFDTWVAADVSGAFTEQQKYDIDTVLTLAQQAKSTAVSAMSLAEDAKSEAASAVTTASGASSMAQSAYAGMEQIQEDLQELQNDVSTAQSAGSLADTALTTAQTASSAAQSAETSAASAVTSVTDIQDDIQALDTATTAMETRLDTFESSLSDVEDFVDAQTDRIDTAIRNGQPPIDSISTATIEDILDGTYTTSSGGE